MGLFPRVGGFVLVGRIPGRLFDPRHPPPFAPAHASLSLAWVPGPYPGATVLRGPRNAQSIFRLHPSGSVPRYQLV